MHIDPRALDLLCSFEGYLQRLNDGTDRVRPYLDPVGIPTIGYGSIWWTDGRRVQMADRAITRAEATELMQHELQRKVEPGLIAYIAVPLHPYMDGAVQSFTYNCGVGALRASGLRTAINQRRWSDVPAEFAKWRMGGGKVLPGLVRRRKAEADLFMEGVRLMRTTQGENDNGGWTATVLRAA